MQQPTVGRIVHYVSYGTPGGEYGQECRAAIITAVEEDSDKLGRSQPVSLAVFNPTGTFFNQGCRHSEGAQTGGTWHWPERV
ncbi:hypothetical protein ABZU94_10315 [Streptomyces mirabilis]|uniref:hypothetical protein n=1 Tax=Streptomyces sp. NPDC005388 TaxID=3156717 RepID=UPI00339FA3CF